MSVIDRYHCDPNERSIKRAKRTVMEGISEKKRLIFESALTLIRERGFHGAPMSQVAANAGVAAGTIYHYFDGKDDLIRALYAYNIDRVIEVVNEASAVGETRKERFFNIWNRLYHFYIDNDKVLVFFEQYLNSPYNTDRSPDHYRGTLYDFFRKGMDEGEITRAKPELLLMLIFGSVSSAAKLKLFGKVRLVQSDLDKVAAILWKGISTG